jgi:glutamate dehydrogenase/leucine dehydrogenase
VTAVVTGKPVALGGSLGRREATGRGVLFTVNEAIKRFKLAPEQTSVVVQGSGNVGGIGAQLMHEKGYKIIAISDVGGGIHNSNGLDIPAVLDYLQKNRSLEGYPNADPVGNKELLEIECDVLAPCATRIRSRPRTPIVSSARSWLRERTVRRLRRPIRYCMTRESSLFRTFLRTPAALRSLF